MIAPKLLKKCLLLGLVGLLLLFGTNVPPVKAITDDFQAADEPVAADSPDDLRGSIGVNRLNIRSGPGTQFPVIGVARYQEIVNLTGRNAAFTWLQVRRANGQQGWAYAPFINASAAHLSALPIIDDVPPPPPPAEPSGTVTAYRLNVRSGPGTHYNTVCNLKRNQVVALIGRNATSTWLQIRQPNNSEGWVSARYIWSGIPIHTLPITGGEIPNPLPDEFGYVTVSKLNVRSGPGMHYGIMGWLYRYQRVRLLDRSYDGRWLKVEIGPNYQGWVYARYIQNTVPDPIW